MKQSLWWALAGLGLIIFTTSPMLAIAQVSESADQAEIARKAYDRDDSRPVENWFGCSPEIEDIADSEDKIGEPSDARVASETETTGNCSAEQPDENESSTNK